MISILYISLDVYFIFLGPVWNASSKMLIAFRLKCIIFIYVFKLINIFILLKNDQFVTIDSKPALPATNNHSDYVLHRFSSHHIYKTCSFFANNMYWIKFLIYIKLILILSYFSLDYRKPVVFILY
jgi:hypothetical protein